MPKRHVVRLSGADSTGFVGQVAAGAGTFRTPPPSAAAAWAARRNAGAAQADRRFTTADARTKLQRLYPTIHG